MSTEAATPQQQKQREFMQLLPVTLAIAGLPAAPIGSYFNEGQMDARATSLKAAYKVARQLVLEMAK